MEVFKVVKNRLLFSIKSTVVSIFIFSVLLTATVAISLQYYFNAKMAEEYTSRIFKMATENTASDLTKLNQQVENTLEILSQNPDIKSQLIEEHNRKDIFKILELSQHFYAIYIGLDNGEFYEVINLDASPLVRSQIKAKANDRWAVIEIKMVDGEKKKITHFYTKDHALRHTISQPTDYDPVERMWFSRAEEDTIYKSSPYLFQHLQAPGQTYSLKLAGENSVIAIDIALSSVSEYLLNLDNKGQQEFNVEMFLFEKEGQLIASNTEQRLSTITIPASKPLPLTAKQQALINSMGKISVSNESDWAPLDFAISGRPAGYSVDVLNLISDMTGLELSYINGFSWAELVNLFKEEKLQLLNASYDNQPNRALGILSQSFLQTPFAIITQPGEADITRLSQLYGKTLAISADWSIIEEIKAFHPQIKVVEVPSTLEVLKSIQQGRYYAGIDNRFVLQYTAKQFFIDKVQYHFDLAQNKPPLLADLHFLLPKAETGLLEIINLAIDNISDEQKEALKQKWLFNEQQLNELKHVGVVPYKEVLSLTSNPQNFNHLLQKEINKQNMYLFISQLNGHDEYLALLIPKSKLLQNALKKLRIAIMVTAGLLLILLPLCWLFAKPIVEPIKRLAEHAERIKERQYDHIEFHDSNIIEIQELTDSMAGMTASIKTYQQNQTDLMDSFIELIGQAIDDKSPYTAGHCERVPELGMMLAEVASNSDATPFKQFKFNNDDEIREFKIAAWLHDCGKITTPEHIVDKGTKLEAIYNRIHEIRMRFEVLWRDEEIDYWQKVQAQPEQQDDWLAQKDLHQQQLRDDFAFIANANIGGEFMSEKHIERLHQLSTKTWQRFFDDTLGLSPVEELRTNKAEQPLPVTEQLLANKPEHIIAHDHSIEYDKKLGINMTIPEFRANLGELHNLVIARGTLTAEDRFKVNEHIISTIRMLDKMPFPQELANVPRYASTHHETLIGTGYPRKLTAEQLSIPERVLVLADIFEALTAADRPYKKAKPLSVAIDILYKMAQDQHVDMDIFKLFLSSGIYQDYAKRYLSPAQIDAVDIEFYLNKRSQSGGEAA
ncbi:hypothetical protein PULV_a1840 [Pseudoalteromonas ulvae UL12]|uniref:Phosphohydrolase n=1 Tax=Pseudoalteromonas ulvae TaxID=107327 RepID=A0A244CN39_PSEDV|nr:HD domain-containing phosphohydrolase [Pseudoalteromonas ulvae]MBE0364242.1 hypothetical protein [Pseudoalteromonas ulvae UL12]OUL57005.1 phosphohydrolase [Pseudoalteromonas ulvae]